MSVQTIVFGGIGNSFWVGLLVLAINVVVNVVLPLRHRPTACSRIAAAIVLLLAVATTATGARADDAAADAPEPPPPAPPPASCDSFRTFFVTKCPLTWYGVSLYGTLDMGGTWQSHGVPFSSNTVTGDEYLLSKNGNRAQWNPAPNSLSQSVVGIRGNEPFPDWASDVAFVFDLEAAFDPYSFKLADGPGSVAGNAGVPLSQQNANADSSRAGQFYNSLGYLGVSSPTYGTLTIFRQNSLTLDGVIAYDPSGASYAFSPIGYQGTACGGGDTEDCRYSTALKYRINVGPLRAAALYQFGGYDLNNAAQGAYQFQAGGDVREVAGGTLSVDGIYSHVTDAVAVSLAGNTLPNLLPQVLTATISDNTSWMALLRYERDKWKFYGGYEWIQYAPASDPQTSFSDIGGTPLCAGCAALNDTNISNTAFNAHDKILQIFWVGARYAIAEEWTLMTGYYQYLQDNFGAGAACGTSAKSTCSGAYRAVSLAADWQFAAKFDAYTGLMYQNAEGGLANGFLHHNTVDPTVGLRFKF